MKQIGRNVTGVQGDASDLDDLDRLYDTVKREKGSLDVLWASAGGGEPAPLGVLLPSGLGLKIDDTDMGRAGFVRCLPNGCVAEVILEDKLLKSLEGGKTATFIIFQTPEEGIGFPMSLAGFGEGYDKLP